MKPKRNYVPGHLDNCQTPGYALEPLIPYLFHFDTIWECAKGEGYLAIELITRGYKVVASGLPDLDFLVSHIDYFTCIVTNPPYGLKYDFIQRCYEIGKPWALLMPIETVGAARAQEQFKKYGISIIFMSKRVNFKMPTKGWVGSAQFPVAWFTWNLGIENGKHEFFDASHWTKQYREKFECEITDL